MTWKAKVIFSYACPIPKAGKESLRPSEDGSEPRHHNTAFPFRKSPVPLPGPSRPAACPDTGRHRLPPPPQPRTEAGPTPLTAATPALPRLSSSWAGERNAAAPGTRRGATLRLKVAGAPGDSHGSSPPRAALPPSGAAPQEEARAGACGRGGHPPPRRPEYLTAAAVPPPRSALRQRPPTKWRMPSAARSQRGLAAPLRRERLLPAPFLLVG